MFTVFGGASATGAYQSALTANNPLFRQQFTPTDDDEETQLSLNCEDFSMEDNDVNSPVRVRQQTSRNTLTGGKRKSSDYLSPDVEILGVGTFKQTVLYTHIPRDAAIPTMTMILGANLLRGLKGSKMQLQLIIGIVFVRYIALPILGTVIVTSAVRYGLVQPDPLYKFVLLLQFALPPAMNISTMTQLFGVGESECSVIMLSMYALASITLMPVLKVLLLTALGSFLAIDWVGILGEDARKHLNNIVFFVFNPALVSSNLAKSITMKSMASLWFMPLNILITFIIGSLLGLFVMRITKTPQDLRGLVLGCCAAGNMGNLPLIIIPAVCREKGSPFGDVATCYAHGLAYASLSMAIGAIYIWSYVYNIVRMYSSTITTTSMEEIPTDVSKSCPGQLLPLKAFTPVEDSLDQLKLSTSMEITKIPVSQKVKQYLETFTTHINLKMLFAPSTTGAIVGFIIGLVPIFRKALVGDDAPLRVVQDSASMLGDAAIPTMTMILGANLLRGLKGSKMQLQLIIGIVFVRYIALPILGTVIVTSAVRYGLVQPDPLYKFVLLLQFALPPAMNISTMTQLFGVGESECSVIMLSMYALASITLTLWSTFFMWLVVT